jgi:hypothetical protein
MSLDRKFQRRPWQHRATPEELVVFRQANRLRHVLAVIARYEATGRLLRRVVGQEMPELSAEAVLHRLDTSIDTLRIAEARLAIVADDLTVLAIEATLDKRQLHALP